MTFCLDYFKRFVRAYVAIWYFKHTHTVLVDLQDDSLCSECLAYLHVEDLARLTKVSSLRSMMFSCLLFSRKLLLIPAIDTFRSIFGSILAWLMALQSGRSAFDLVVYPQRFAVRCGSQYFTSLHHGGLARLCRITYPLTDVAVCMTSFWRKAERN